MAKQTIKGDIVDGYLSRFSELPSLSLARKVYKENSTAFKDLEEVRRVIRYHRGLSGEANRKTMTDKKHVKPVGHFKQNPYNLPESHAETREPYKLPKACNNILVISDLHIPYHDVPSITAALEYGKVQNVNCVLILGDLLDFATISRFEKDPRARSVYEEFEATRQFLVSLRKVFPTQKIIFLKGNHDVRYEKWLYTKAPEIFDDPYYQLETRLGLSGLKIDILDDNVLIKAGKLFLTHGHLLIRGVFAPVNSARGAYLRAKSSILIGHTHQVSNHVERDLKGEITSTWSIGCLCTLKPGYDPMNTKHSNGFAHIHVENNGNYSVKNIMINNGKIL